MPPRYIVPLAAGALLSLGCGRRERPLEPAVNPPMPADVPPDPTPEPPVGPVPPTATNPPIPLLVIEPNGTCHESFIDARRGQPPAPSAEKITVGLTTAYVHLACAAADPTPGTVPCGPVVVCPPVAAAILEAWTQKHPE